MKDADNIGPSGGYSTTGATNSSGYITGFTPGVGNYTSTVLKATISNQTSAMAVAKYSFGSWGTTTPAIVGKMPVHTAASGIPLTLYGGVEWIQYTNPSDPQSRFYDDGYLFSTTTPLTTISNTSFASGAKQFYVTWAGAKYGLTKDLDVIGAYYHYIQAQYGVTAATCANPENSGNCAGTEDMISGVLDWRFLPKWDAYIGTMFSQVNGGLSNGYISRNNLSTDAGVRFRF